MSLPRRRWKHKAKVLCLTCSGRRVFRRDEILPVHQPLGQPHLPLRAVAFHHVRLDRLTGAQPEVIRAICCEWMHVATQSEVIRAIFSEDSPCCAGGRTPRRSARRNGSQPPRSSRSAVSGSGPTRHQAAPCAASSPASPPPKTQINTPARGEFCVSCGICWFGVPGRRTPASIDCRAADAFVCTMVAGSATEHILAYSCSRDYP